MTPRATSTARTGRRGKAIAFRDAAELIEQFMNDGTDLRDAYVTMCVHAGIAAADVICMDELGEYCAGQRHSDATRLLEKVDTTLARQLDVLLSMKTKAGYSGTPVSNEQINALNEQWNRS